jgi:preprotein translocase subunit SecD
MRSGRTIGAAVDAAVRRAWPAIRDSNISTLITSTLLIFLTSGSVQGFAVTLAIGVVVSLISSIIITHNLLAIVLNFNWARSQGVLGVARGRA